MINRSFEFFKSHNKTASSSVPEKPHPFPLRARMLIMFGTLFALSTIIFGLIIIYGVPLTRLDGLSNTLRNDTIKELSSLADDEKEDLINWLNDRRADMHLSSESEILTKHVSNLCADIRKHRTAGLMKDEIRKKLFGEIDYELVSQYLRSLVKLHKTYKEIMITDTDTWLLVASTNENDVGHELPDKERFTEALTPGHEEIVFVKRDPLTERPCLYIVRAITAYRKFHAYEEKKDAVIISKIDTNDFISPLLLEAGEGLGITGEINLIDQNGNYLTALKHPLPGVEKRDQFKHMKLAKPALLALSGVEGIITEKDYRGKKVLAAIRHIPITAETSWGLIVKIDEDEVFLPLRNNILLYMSFAFLTGFVVLGLTYIIARRLSKPLEKLSSTARKIEAGDLTARSSVTTSDEIGSLSAAFNAMAEKIQGWNAELERQIKERTEELVQSEEMFRSLVRTAPNVILYLSPEYIIMEFNEEAERVYGRMRKDVIGQNYIELFILAEARDVVVSDIKKVLAGKPSRDFENRIVSANGKERLFSWNVDRLVDSNNNTFGVICVGQDITERRLVEEKLQEALKFNQQIIANAQEGILAYDTEYKFTLWNPRMETTTGIKAEDLIGKHSLEVFPFLKEQGVYALHERAMSGETVSTPDYPFYVTGTGRSGWAQSDYVPLRNANGNIIGILGTVRDITERKKIELALLDKQYLLSESQRIAHIGSWDFDIKTKHLEWTEETYRIYGVLPDTFDLSLESFFNLIHTDDRAAMHEWVRACLAGGKPDELEFRIILSSGDVRTLRGRGNLIYDSENTPVRMIGTVQDITVHKRAEMLIFESEKKYRDLFESAIDAIFILDIEGNIVDVNSIAYTRLGYTKEEMLSMHITRLDPPEFAAKVPERLAQIQEHGFAVFESAHIKKDGTVMPVEVNSRLYVYEGKKVYFSVIRDITQRKKLEAQLLQAQKMESIGVLAGGIAHDFNNALTAIIGFAHILKMRSKENEQLSQYIEQIITVSNMAANTVRSLLAFSRKQIIAPRPVDLNEIVAGMKQLIKNIIGEDIELTTDICGHPLIAMADSAQIEQVLINLATNARDAMPHGGRLKIKTDRFYIDVEEAKALSLKKPGYYGKLLVSDTGCGMDQKTMQTIFEPFFTTKEVGKGSGLGLAMVYGIIKQHEGHITINSEPGHGAAFNIYLPLTDRVRAEEETFQLVKIKSGTETILIAEDNEDVRNLFKNVLERSGYTVITAEDGEDAVNKFAENQNAVRLCILDVIMPKKRGKAAFDEIRKTSPDIKVLFISGYTADVLDRHEISNSGLNFISKPISPDTLLQKVREILDNEGK